MKKLVISSLFFVLVACSAEKTTLSPIVNSIIEVNDTKHQDIHQDIKEKNNKIFYSSELTNQTSILPKFTNSAVNKEVDVLKFQIKEYVYSVQEYNLVGRERALNNIEKAYRKIQKLRSRLNPDEDNVLNRALVKIKSNISQIEALHTK